MKLRDYKKHTFELCRNYYLTKSPKVLRKVIKNLQRHARYCDCKETNKIISKYFITDKHTRHFCQDPGAPEDFNYYLNYCSDRMSSSRAKMLLRLAKEQGYD